MIFKWHNICIYLKEIIILHYRCPDTRIVVDGAHALLSIPINLKELNVDYYVSNCHKWFSAPKGTAFMYVKKEHQYRTRPLVISHGWGSGFISEFIWQGGVQNYTKLFLTFHVDNTNFKLNRILLCCRWILIVMQLHHFEISYYCRFERL